MGSSTRGVPTIGGFGVSGVEVNAIIDIESLSKVYQRVIVGQGGYHALTDCSLRVMAGEVMAILGLNGAGKSTLLKCALGLVRPSSGRVTLSGPAGYLPEFLRLRRGVSPRSILRMVLRCTPLRREEAAKMIDAWLARLTLNGEGWRGGELSNGMERRLGIAMAMIHRPLALFLDEPSDGLDPEGKRVVRELTLEARVRGAAILLSSHVLSEVEQVADRIAILRRGRIVFESGMSSKDFSAHGRCPGRDAEDFRLSGKGTLEEVFRRHAL